jgi:hypothetical protein
MQQYLIHPKKIIIVTSKKGECSVLLPPIIFLTPIVVYSISKILSHYKKIIELLQFKKELVFIGFEFCLPSLINFPSLSR